MSSPPTNIGNANNMSMSDDNVVSVWLNQPNVKHVVRGSNPTSNTTLNVKKANIPNVRKSKMKANTGPSPARSDIVNLKGNNEEPQDEKKKKKKKKTRQSFTEAQRLKIKSEIQSEI